MGTASARLLVAGAARRDRLDALSLLGLLIDHADPEGSVRLPFETLVGEFGVAPERGRELLEALMAVDVVRAVGDDVSVGGTLPVHAGAFRLSGFVANVATVLDAPRGDRQPAPAEPAPLPSPGLAPRRRRGRRHPSATRVLPRVLAGAAAAFVVVWSTASPSGEPTAVRTVDRASGPTGRAPWAVTPTTVAAGEEVAPVSPDPSPAASPTAPATPPAPSQENADPTGRRPEPASSPPESPGEASTGPSPPSVGPLAPGSPPARTETREPSSPPGPGPGAPPADPGNRCPVGTPGADVTEVRLLAVLSQGLVEVPAQTGVELRGTLRNPSDADLVVRSFEIRVGSGDAAPTVAGSPAPLPVPAAGVAEWRVVLPPEVGVPSLGLVEVRILDWSWTDPVLNAICLS